MKKTLFLIIFFLSALVSNAESNWKLVKFLNSDSNYYDHSINTIECADSNNCIALAVHQLNARLYHSSDQGKKWDLLFDDNKLNKNGPEAISLAYPHKDHIALGFANGTITHSRDGGKTWDTLMINFTDTLYESRNLRIDNLTMADSINGVAIGRLYPVSNGKSGGTFLLTTKDGWKSTKIIDLNEIPGDISLTSPFMVNKDTIMLVTYKRLMQSIIIYTSYNKAESWAYTDTLRDIYTYGGFDANPLSKSPDGSFWLAGESTYGVGDKSIDIIYKSDKFGGKWTKIYEKELEPSRGLQEIAFADSLNGVAVGQFSKVLRTSNRGVTWKQDTLTDERNGIDKSTFLNITYCGSTPIISDMQGRIWILDNTSDVQEAQATENIVYPNPAGDYLNIKDIENISGDIEIHNIAGKTVMQVPASSKIDIRNLPAGVYYVTINGKTEKFVKK